MKLNKIIAILAVTVVAVGAMAQGGGGGGGGRRGGMQMMFGQAQGSGDPAMLLLGGGFGGRGGGGGGNGRGNAQLENIEADIKLTDDQKTKISGIRDAYNTKRREMMRPAGGGGGGGGFTPPSEETMKAAAKLGEDTAKEVNAVLTADQQKRLKQISVQLAGNRAAANKDMAKELGLSEDQNTKIADLIKKSGEAMMAIGKRIQDGELQPQDMRAEMTKINEVLQAEIGKVLTDAQKAKLKEMQGPEFKRDEA